jgi:hypothetical protein
MRQLYQWSGLLRPTAELMENGRADKSGPALQIARNLTERDGEPLFPRARLGDKQR